MAYKKVYYDEIWDITSNGAKLSSDWVEKMDAIRTQQDAFVSDISFTGKAAESTKKYFEEVHGTLLATLMTICQTYASQASDYYVGYKTKVDSGDGSEFGLRYTTIVYDEVNTSGKIPRNIQNLKSKAYEVENSALSVKRQISDLVNISSPSLNSLIQQLDKATKKATEVSKKVEQYENSRRSDFVNIDKLITHAKRIIEYQLGANRNPVRSYKPGSIGAATDFKDLSANLNACIKTVKDFQNSEHYDEAMELTYNRDAIIEEEEKAGREWVKWIAVGVAVVGSVAVIVVTAGGATPLVCAAVGAGTGVVTAATSSFTDNYIDNGSLVEGMDWSDFGKDCLIGGVTGAISGYVGATSIGSVVKQPVDKAITSLAGSIVENGAEGLINIGWDVGEAIIAGKPGGEILTIIEQDTADMMKDMVIDGATSFAGDYVSGHFDVNSATKSFTKKLGENITENATTAFTSNGLNMVWDVGEAMLDPSSSKTFTTILTEEALEHGKGFAGDFVTGVTTGAVGDLVDEIKIPKFENNDRLEDLLKVSKDILGDVAGSTSGAVLGGIATQTVDIIFTDKDSIDIEQLWKENLDSGRSIVKSAGTSAGKHISNEIFKDQSFYNSVKKKDYDGDGTVEVVVFDKYLVLKEDYDAAREVAGKGAYKDYTVQDVLGLPKNTAISEKNIKQEQISINELKKSEYKARKTTNVTRMDYKVDYNQVKDQLFDKDLFNDNKAGDYTYTETEKGKTASGYLKVEKGERNLVAQRTVGGDDRKSSDDGGHLIGSRFSGSGGEENLDAQDSNVNRSAYNQKEEEWEKAIKNGDKVYVHVETHKNGDSDRPTEYMGYAIIEHKDGTRDLDPFVFANKKGSKEEEWIVIEK